MVLMTPAAGPLGTIRPEKGHPEASGARITIPVAVIVTALAWKQRLPILAVPVVVSAWLGELLAATLTKSVVQRPRPPEAVRLVMAHGWSFPCGHTANAVVVFATLGLWLPPTPAGQADER